MGQHKQYNDLSGKHTLHSHKVQESSFHRSPSLRSCPLLSVQSVLLRRFSSRLICEQKHVFHHFDKQINKNR